MKKARIYALCTALLLGVTGCSSSESNIQMESKEESEVTNTNTQPESSTNTEEVTKTETSATTTTTAKIETKTVKAVSMCSEHSAAIDEDGILYMWGNNEHGVLGDGTTTNKLTPTKIMDKVDMMSVSGGYSAAITEDRSLYTWGRNFSGQLGDGTTIDRQTPVKIMDKIQTVSVGSKHSAAITEDGDLYMWGWNFHGQLGDGKHFEELKMSDYVEEFDRSSPYRIMANIKSVSLGKGCYSAAITNDGDLYMWGINNYGMLGDGTTEDKYFPTKVLSDVKAVSIGGFHSAAIIEDGSLYMWGGNAFGQLGDGTTEDKHTPIKVLDNVKSISLGEYHSAAVTEDGSLYLWGMNYNGQIGNGKNGGDLYSFDEGIDCNKPIKIMDNVESISLGFSHSAAVTEDGKLYTWGENEDGQLGDGTTEDKSTPTQIIISNDGSSTTSSNTNMEMPLQADTDVVSEYIQDINDFLGMASIEDHFPKGAYPIEFKELSGFKDAYRGFGSFMTLQIHTDESGNIEYIEATTGMKYTNLELESEWRDMMCIPFVPIVNCSNIQEVRDLWETSHKLLEPVKDYGYDDCAFTIRPEFLNKSSEKWIGALCIGSKGTKILVYPNREI